MTQRVLTTAAFAATSIVVAALIASTFAGAGPQPALSQSTLAVVKDGSWQDESGAGLALPVGANGADATKTSWSPDGSEIAFACNVNSLAADDAGLGLCSATQDETTLWTIAAAPVRFPVWSTDGDQLAYAALGHEGHGSLWVTRRNEPGVAETLCEEWCPLFRYYSLAWSPDASTLAAVAETPGTGGHPARIILFDVATHNFEFLNQELPGLQHGPTWSPDGEQLAFSSNAEGDFDIWSVDLATREPRRLTEEDGGAVNPAWSPDGSEIVFLSRAHGGGTTVRSVGSQGGQSVEVIEAGELRTPRFVGASN